jgi:hypothetical protein
LKKFEASVLFQASEKRASGTSCLNIMALPPKTSGSWWMPGPWDGDDLKLQKIGRADNPQTHVLFAGCKDNQTSADAYISGAYNGAFTYYFCKTLRDVQGTISPAPSFSSACAPP